jgi:hypothetical protein
LNLTGGSLFLFSSTLAGNSASDRGGGLFNASTIQTRNTIIAQNRARSAPDLSGGLGSLGYNLIGDGTGGGGFDDSDLVGTSDAPIDPMLGPLQDNGGPTFTMALLPDSPAIAAGTSDGAPRTDQRGLPRHDPPDIGAFEVQDRPAQPRANGSHRIPIFSVASPDQPLALGSDKGVLLVRSRQSGRDVASVDQFFTAPEAEKLPLLFVRSWHVGAGEDYPSDEETLFG